ncbi:hypothetical protein AB4853_16465 [Bradyrhizobium sp. 1050_B9_N1_2]|uniref:hypothetical protein n=1 Tax=Bradyrhizobium sp. 1050_B9_N1_2 TaxID=3238688 RepID=UPI003EDC2536
MTWADLLPWISLAVSIGTPIAIFVGRNWLKARIERGVQFSFDNKLETVRMQMRKNEEAFKADLRNKEGEISLLRSSVLNGSASRQSLLDKRRFEAVEKVWTAVNDMARLKSLSSFIALLNIKEVSKRARDPKMQQFLSMMGQGTPDIGDVKNVARDERPFLPELAWAYFSAYSTILFGNLALYKVLQIGMEEPERVLTREGVKKILKATLPHQSEWIDSTEPERYHYLLEELEEKLIGELRKILDGEEADQAATERGKSILRTVNMIDLERVQQAAADVNRT